ncbi:MAG TPA: heme-copper oxidase subunit III [Verrucomicrobiota bacterium]|nr:heme-copper oxidase subunit III [Verrucomicrobiota bacterium]
MEIPYTAQPRPDTGVYNAKIGIWLFLASEVMLFGALFSSYILLRVGALSADWPVGLLNVPIGTVNTAVLILSSVTVVMAWASLKMGRLDRFKIYQAITIVCALIFLVIKSFEYRDKFTHYEVWLDKPLTVIHGTEEVKIHRMTGHIEGKPAFLTLPKVKAKNLESIAFIPDEHHYSEGKVAMHQHDAHAEHKAIEIPVSDIKRLTSFVPAHSTYFAIYFTLTGLHALHVLGGALVMAYLFFTASKMYKTEPDRFTNRIEVSGLFWHFVDLVWIFLFPVLYLL